MRGNDSMNYLAAGGDIHKYDLVNSNKLCGEHKPGTKFSIMIPTYKRVGYLKQAVDSVLAQTYGDYEIVITDNNDDDDEMAQKVETLIRSYNEANIVLYRNEKNIGIYGNTLRAAQLAQGEYVVLLNDDDLLHPRYLEVVNAFIEKYGYKGIIGSEPAAFSDAEPQMPKLPKEIHAFSVSKAEFFFGCCVTSPGLCYPRKILYDIYNAYEPLLMGDQIIQYKALEKYGLVFIAFPIARYRISDNATLKDNVLTDMIVNMCKFRKQTAERDIRLRIFSYLFYKEYCAWYIESTLYFWKKRRLKAEIVKKLQMPCPNYYTAKQSVMNMIIETVHMGYANKHRKHYDFISIPNGK